MKTDIIKEETRRAGNADPEECLRAMTDEIGRRDQMLRDVNRVAALLLMPEVNADIDSLIMKSMEIVCNSVGAGRVNLWRNETRDGILYHTCDYSWLRAGITEHRALEKGLSFTHDIERQGWKESFLHREHISGPLSEMTEKDRLFMSPYGMKSVIIIPLFINDSFWGAFSVDEFEKEKHYTEDEVLILKSISLMMASTINRHSLNAEINEAKNRVAQIMFDSAPIGCSVMDENMIMAKVNLEMTRLFSLKNKQEFLDRFYDLFPEYQPDGTISLDSAREHIRIAFRDGYDKFFFMHEKLDGTPLPVEATLIRIPTDKGPMITGYLRDLREYNSMMDEINRQRNLFETMSQISSVLLEPAINAFRENLHKAMGMIGNATGADRVYLMKLRKEGDALYTSQIYEWSERDDAPQADQDAERLWAPLGCESDLQKGKCINSLVRDLKPEHQAILAPYGVVSTLNEPIFFKEELWGVVGFDNCREERVFSKSEEMILRSASHMIANALIRNEMTQELLETSLRLGAAVEEANEADRLKNITITSMESILNSVDAMTYVTVPGTGELLFVNSNMKKSLGRDESDDFVGEYCYKVLKRDYDGICPFCPCHELDKDPSKTVVWEEHIPDTGKYIRRSDRYIDWPNGEKVHLQHAVDITELVNAKDEAERSSRYKSDFLAKMSHEIRTPMNAIIGMAELAIREDQPETVREHVHLVKQAGVSLLSIVNDILDISKIEAGNIQVSPVEYSLTMLLNDVISIIRMRAIDSRIRFVVYLDSNLPDKLIGDETKIRQILINILGNAVKYTDKGYVSFTVHGTMTGESTLNLTMEVKDSGVGIRSEHIEKLFDSYLSPGQGWKTCKEGVGLGLPISHSLVKLMGGDISAESQFGVGSVFTVVLPQKILNPEKLAVVANPGKISAIVYENRELYADSIVYAIENLGVKCEHVSNDEIFRSRIMAEQYTHVFISHHLYEGVRDTIIKYGGVSQIVMLAEFGESIPKGSWRVLSMPMHAVCVATIFNSETERFSYNSSEELTVRFVAPDATVLVVDDIRINLKVASGLLSPYKMEIDLCNSGAKALEAVRSKRYDIVFMDHRMPEMDGVEAMEHIRAMGAEDEYYLSLPIVALTANALCGMKEQYLQSGFNDYLTKPVDTVELNTVLEKWIPKEKQTYDTAELDKTEIAHSAAVPILTIAGVDVKKGVYLTGGDPDRYFDILAAFAEEWQNLKNDIVKYHAKGEIKLLTILVHALKGASAVIGATRLSEAAYAMEMAGQREDRAYIKNKKEELLDMLQSMINSINEALSRQNADSGKTDASADAGQFYSELGKLSTALRDLDFESVNRSVDTLLASAPTLSHRNSVRKVSKQIMLFEYEKADALINSLVKAG